ncbi:MAG: thiamine pyrophosphate-dependent dehydrogenase E1 component subunit alpha [Verrucomicrobia bacterium]|jgi:TPP-dependent pyruvate/acetoin dehydrogenase alpha subunit|nr:thiamine pyrophosphate-dependent dehydrogenase E1 component subunit alpha [Verrucomicrobiota bacterium]MBT7068230.1 thiamine pyrophosphate-dependent dehydrogenase E1 component subunit alpha [Verrucomicrobiota bacterium]MBT7699634.1 thiamine pyrophosphate-dependent dehydrogenase E1 component subunit alpha [Verrucomicrobiota bacterium]
MTSDVAPQTAIDLLRRMERIRLLEEAIAERYPEEKMRCPTHLSTGQETVPSAIGVALRRDDQVFSTHRSHAHYVGKGGDLGALVAELYGKAGGCCGGRGGSMHLSDRSVGFVASTAIVANSIPLAVGAALANRLLGNGRVGCALFGDAAVEEGVFSESVNFAALRALPVLFVCENNQYSVFTHLRDRQPAGRRIHEMVAAMGVRTVVGDGNDALAVLAAVEDAAAHARNRKGPVFLEFATYRWREHCGPFYDNDLGYRTAGEFEAWRARDPVARLEGELVSRGDLDAAGLRSLQESVRAEVAAAFDVAEASPFPPAADAYRELFVAQDGMPSQGSHTE